MKNTFTLIALLFSAILLAQQTETIKKESFWDNVRFGGGLGLDFGNNSTTISISPTAIYDFNETFSLGAGVGYQYSKRGDVKSNVYSVSAVSLFNPFQGVQLSAEFEQLFINQKVGTEKVNRQVPALYLGAAYRVSNNVSMGVRYDVLYNKNKSVYASAFSPIIRVFF